MDDLELRVPPVLALVLMAVAAWGLSLFDWRIAVFASTNATRFLAAISFVAGVGFSFGGIVAFRRARTTVSPTSPGAASTLVSSGVYRITRNPMYVGMALILFAWAVSLGSWLSQLSVAAFVAYISRFQIRPEELALSETFGADYEDYRRRVRRWL